jgi:hypothetical protein
VITRKNGAERLRNGDTDLGVDLLQFWQWSVSDLISNATRGRLAEFIVARALGIRTEEGFRDEWAKFDLLTPSGVTIEVKSSAYVQSWLQTTPSSINFGTKATLGWDPETNTMETTARRHAHVYVFAILRHLDATTIDPLDVSQWLFYVLPTSTLNARKRSQHSITLNSLERECKQCVDFSGLADAVAAAASEHVAAEMGGTDSPSE